MSDYDREREALELLGEMGRLLAYGPDVDGPTALVRIRAALARAEAHGRAQATAEDVKDAEIRAQADAAYRKHTG